MASHDSGKKPTDGSDNALVLKEETAKTTISNEDGVLPAGVPAFENELNEDKADKEAIPPDETESNYGWDDKKHNLIIKEGDSFLGRYEFERHLGAGAFGKVIQALDRFNNRHVAIKIIKNIDCITKQGKEEVRILEKLEFFDQKGKFGFVHLQRDFIWRNHLCLVFQVLASTLYNIIQDTNFKGISLRLTRIFGRQICEVLDFLAQPKINVMHCDIKPENIMLCHPTSTRIKVIDFGAACEVKNWVHPYIQSRFYRAPEVLLGAIPYDRAVDMWSVGCTMVELHTGWPLFNGFSEIDQFGQIVQVLGMPPEHILAKGLKTPTYFTKDFEEKYIKNKLESSVQSVRGNGNRKLRDVLAIHTGGPKDQVFKAEYSPRYGEVFHDLMSKMLHFDPKTRILPTEALKHKFFNQNTLGSASDQGNSTSATDLPGPSSFHVPNTK